MHTPQRPRWHLCRHPGRAMAPLCVPGCAMPSGKTAPQPDACSSSGRLRCDDQPASRHGQCDHNRSLRKAPLGRRRTPLALVLGHAPAAEAAARRNWRPARPVPSYAGFRRTPHHLVAQRTHIAPSGHSPSPAAPAGTAHSTPEQESDADYSWRPRLNKMITRWSGFPPIGRQRNPYPARAARRLVITWIAQL